MLAQTIESREVKEVHIKNVGKFKPTTYLIAYKDGRVKSKNKGNNTGVEESPQ